MPRFPPPALLPPALLPMALLVLLAACGTPQDRCIDRATRELRAVEQLLAGVEGNLARGYAWDEKPVTRVRWEICGYRQIQNADGTFITRPDMCMQPYTDTIRSRVAIDPETEKRKRDALIARRRALLPQAEANIAACKATYPQ